MRDSKNLESLEEGKLSEKETLESILLLSLSSSLDQLLKVARELLDC